MAAWREAEGMAEALDFESAMTRLEEIVAELEDGELKLAEALALYEEGVRLARLAQEQLSGAEGRIEALLADGSVTDVEPETRGVGSAG
jgi:exodeoxyribonuclease VII small subunit